MNILWTYVCVWLFFLGGGGGGGGGGGRGLQTVSYCYGGVDKLWES